MICQKCKQEQRYTNEGALIGHKACMIGMFSGVDEIKKLRELLKEAVLIIEALHEISKTKTLSGTTPYVEWLTKVKKILGEE